MKGERQQRRDANSHLEQDICIHIFIIAMIGMVVVCALITYTISVPTR
jgi:hypothetical protein